MPAATFAVIGAGYRAQYFLRIARALPERFRVQAMVVRAPDAAAAMAAAWDVKVHPSLDALLAAGRPDFLVVSVSPGAATALLRQAAAAGLPVLTETPPATSLDGLLEIWRLVEAGARIHVAEQYPRQPLNAARLALVRAGRLGRITSAQFGVAHAYHGVSLLRAFLGVGFAPARISARGFTATVATPPDRQGPPRAPGMVEELQVIAQLDFGDRLGITDFTGGQYRSWIRAARFLVRGDHGEIKDTELRYLKDYRTSVELELRRIDTGQNGSPENYWHRGIMAGADWVYETPYPGVTLGDDEIAGAQLLDGMVALCGGGAGPYPFAEAAQDQYLALAIEQARSTGGIVTTAIQPWAESAGRQRSFPRMVRPGQRHRAGIIGLGAAVTKHALALRDLQDRIEVAGAWSPSPARRERFAATTGLPVTDTAEAILQDPAIDLVLILTPPWSHLELVERCAEAGKHVLLEKPIEATLERSERAVEICEAAGVTLGLVFQNRFRTPYLRLASLVAEGRLGRVLSAALSLRLWRADAYYAEGDRAMRARDGGGVLLSQAIHNLDQLIGLLGPVQSACGFTATSGLRPIDTEDVAGGALRWAAGAIGTIDATTVAFPGVAEQLDLSGEHGSARLQRDRLQVWLKDGTTIEEAEDRSDPAVARDYLAHRRLIEDMLDALDTGRAPRTDGRGSLHVHRLVDALLRAAASGRVEPV